jgi:hypothetical protein
MTWERKKGLKTTCEVRRQFERKSGTNIEYKLATTPYKLVRKQMKAWPLRTPMKFYGFPEEVPLYYQNADFVQDFSLRMERLLRSISYLGPLRSKGQRLYSWAASEPESVGYSGENTIGALLAAKDRQLNAGKKKKRRPFQQFIAEKLQQLELIDKFEVRQISEHRKDYEVKVKTPGSPSWVDLPDVGFGVSQVLPVLVQCFYAPSGSILFIEQPELHLHPRAQSHLADLFIDVLMSREHGKDRNIQLIIETHSEHFLHRLQRRSRKLVLNARFRSIKLQPTSPIQQAPNRNSRPWNLICSATSKTGQTSFSGTAWAISSRCRKPWRSGVSRLSRRLRLRKSNERSRHRHQRTARRGWARGTHERCLPDRVRGAAEGGSGGRTDCFGRWLVHPGGVSPQAVSKSKSDIGECLYKVAAAKAGNAAARFVGFDHSNERRTDHVRRVSTGSCSRSGLRSSGSKICHRRLCARGKAPDTRPNFDRVIDRRSA